MDSGAGQYWVTYWASQERNQEAGFKPVAQLYEKEIIQNVAYHWIHYIKFTFLVFITRNLGLGISFDFFYTSLQGMPC